MQKHATAQQTYRTAKAAYDHACTVHTQELTRRNFFTLLDQDADTDTLVALELEADAISHQEDAYAALRKAKEALYAWTKQRIFQSAYARQHPEKRDRAVKLFTEIERYPHLEDSLIQLCLDLAPTGA